MANKNKLPVGIHLIINVVIFMCTLSATISNTWTLTERGSYGIFKQCHLLFSCKSAVDVSGFKYLFHYIAC